MILQPAIKVGVIGITYYFGVGNFTIGYNGSNFFVESTLTSALTPATPIAAVLFDVGSPNVIQADWSDYRTSLNFAPISQNEDRGISVEMNKELDNGMTFTSVSAYRQFDTVDSIDADFTDTSIAERTNDAQQKSFSQEFRLAGEFGDSSNWVAGAYYFAQDIESNTRTIGGTELQIYADLGNAAQGLPTLSDITNGVTAISQGLALAGIPFPEGAQGFPAGAFANDDVLQEHDGYAVFGQVDWAVSDSFELSLGARYTDENKDIDAIYTQTNPGTTVPDLTAIGTTFFLFEQWVAGGQVGYEERHRDDPQHQRHGQQQSLDDVLEHAVPVSGGMNLS